MEIESPPARRTPKKVLIVGSTRHQHVQSVDWHELHSVNIVDFEAIVVNVRSLSSDVLKRLKQDYFDKVRVALTRFLISQGRLIVLSDTSVSTKVSAQLQQSNYEWCPIVVDTQSERGDTVEIKNDKFAKLLANLTSWDFYFFVPQGCLRRELTNICGDTYNFSYDVAESPIAVNRYGKALACTWTISVRHKQSTDKLMTLGPIDLLPPIRSLDSRAAINLILEDLLKLPQSSLPPTWIDDVVVPGSMELQNKIEQWKSNIASANAEIAAIHSQLEKIEAVKTLLYGSGVELELIFSKCLEKLGAKITTAKYSQEEFVVNYKGNVCLVECKGVGKSIALAHVRQLMDYMDKFQETEGKKGKGILLGASWRDIPILERTPERCLVFPANVIERAEALQIALVDSVAFFHAYCGFLSGVTSADSILEKIVKTNGVVAF